MGVRAGVEGEGVAVSSRLGGDASGWVNGEAVGDSAGGGGRADWVSGEAVAERAGGVGRAGWVSGEAVGESAGGVGRAGWVSADSVGEDVRDAGGWSVGGGVDTDVGWDGVGAGLGIEVGPSVIIVAWQPANMTLATRKQANSKETRIDYRQTG